MASVIDCVGGAGWVGFIVIINKTASREPQGIGLGKEDHSELCEQTRSLAATEAGLWVSLKGFRGWAGWLASRAAPCLIMYQEARKGVGLSFQFRGRKKYVVSRV